MDELGTVPDLVRERLAAAETLEGIGEIVRSAARELTGAFGATFVLRDGDFCFYADEDAIAPLWKGQRFDISRCISGWAMLNDTTAVVPDIFRDPRIPVAAYSPTFVRSLVMVPVRTPAPDAAIGAYWPRARVPHPDEVAALEALASLVGAAVERTGTRSAPWAPNFGVAEDPALVAEP